MTLAFSCLTVVFEEGQRESWFESPMIIQLSLASLLGFAVLFISAEDKRRSCHKALPPAEPRLSPALR